MREESWKIRIIPLFHVLSHLDIVKCVLFGSLLGMEKMLKIPFVVMVIDLKVDLLPGHFVTHQQLSW
jgi:hypothetical protein